MKKIITFVFAILLLSFSFTSVMASETKTKTDTSTITKKTEITGSVEMSDADFVKISKGEGPVYLGDDTWAELVSEEEMISIVAKNRGISKEKAQVQVLGTSSSNVSTLSTASDVTITAVSYRYIHYYRQFTVKGTWKPQLDIYVKAYALENAFVSIQDLNLIRSYNYISKVFSGKCEARMETNKRIYYVINGDFYNQGTYTTTLGGQAGTSYLSLNCSVSYANNWFGYLYGANYLYMR